ncbi:unnamed protein product [Blepharisma stoltei]|uniref:EF-hand domain-containing protein n=1 Tax=Blepharisma stoltei TaxID=1481888 RepID=A0AAU9KKY6_9CILI|nr:unnamed protein product [Blepharisma stoltei]
MQERLERKPTVLPSERAAYANKLELEEELLLDLTMNLDSFTICEIKKEFDKKSGALDLEDFVNSLRFYFDQWKPNLENRDKIMLKLIIQLFKDIDINKNGIVEWEEFTNYIIEKATALNAMKKTRTDVIKNYSLSPVLIACPNSMTVERLVLMETLDRIGVIEDYTHIVKFYNPETGKTMGKELQVQNEEFQQINIHQASYLYKGPRRVIVNNAAFLPEPEYQYLVTLCNDGTIRSWGTNGSHFHSMNHKGGYPILYCKEPQRAVAWNYLNRILYTGDSEGDIKIWNYEDRESNFPAQVLSEGHEDLVTDIFAIPKFEFLFSCSLDRKVILWDTISNKPRRVYSSHTQGVLSLAFNSEYRLLFSSGFDHDIYVWNPYIDSAAFTIEGHSASLVGVKVLPNSPQIISADIDGYVKVWDIRNLSCVQTFNIEEKRSGERFSLNDFLYIPKLQRLIFGGKSLVFYDYDKNCSPHLVDDNIPLGCYYTPNSQKMVTPIVNKVKLWNALTGKYENFYAPSADGDISCAEMDYLAKRIILGNQKGHVRVYNIKNGALMKSLTDHKAEINCISSSTQLNLIVTSSLDMVIMVHDDNVLSDSHLLYYVDEVWSIAHSLKLVYFLDMLVIGAGDGSVKFWDLEAGELSDHEFSHNREISAIQVVELYPLVFSCDVSGEVKLWSLPPSPYKWCNIYKFLNLDQEGVNSYVQSTEYDNKRHILFIGDEKGCLKAFSFEKLISVLEIAPISSDGRENKLKCLRNQLGKDLPDLPKNLVYQISSMKLHSESIRHLHFMTENSTLITTSYDKNVKLVSTEAWEVIGALQQGLNMRPYAKTEFESQIPWRFYLNTSAIDAQIDSEINKLSQNMEKQNLNPKPHDERSMLIEGRGFMEPQTLMNLIKVKRPNKFSRIPTLKSTLFQTKIKINPQKLSRNHSLMLVNAKAIKDKKLSELNRSMIDKKIRPPEKESKYKILNKSFVQPSKLQTLPSLSNIYKNDNYKSSLILQKRLSKSVFKTASKLAEALSEPYF